MSKLNPPFRYPLCGAPISPGIKTIFGYSAFCSNFGKYNKDLSSQWIREMLAKISLTIETKNLELETLFSQVVKELDSIMKKSGKIIAEDFDRSEKKMLNLTKRIQNLNNLTKKCTDRYKIEAKAIHDSHMRRMRLCSEKIVTRIEMTRNEDENRLKIAKDLQINLKRLLQERVIVTKSIQNYSAIETGHILIRVKKIYEILNNIPNCKKSFDEEFKTLALCRTEARQEVTEGLKKLLKNTEICLQKDILRAN